MTTDTMSDVWSRVRRFFGTRFLVHVHGPDEEGAGESFHTRSVSYALLIATIAVVAIGLLRRTLEIVPPLIWAWFELFEIREIFRFEDLGEELIVSLYETLVTVCVLLVIARAAVAILRLALSRVVLLSDRLVVVEHVLFFSRVHHVRYDRIARLSLRSSILHRLADLGWVAIVTGERESPVTIGPVVKVSRFVSATAQAMKTS